MGSVLNTRVNQKDSGLFIEDRHMCWCWMCMCVCATASFFLTFSKWCVSFPVYVKQRTEKGISEHDLKQTYCYKHYSEPWTHGLSSKRQVHNACTF